MLFTNHAFDPLSFYSHSVMLPLPPSDSVLLPLLPSDSVILPLLPPDSVLLPLLPSDSVPLSPFSIKKQSLDTAVLKEIVSFVPHLPASTSSVHIFSNAERTAFVKHINHVLADVSYLTGRLPLNPQSNEIFEAVKDGLIIRFLSVEMVHLH